MLRIFVLEGWVEILLSFVRPIIIGIVSKNKRMAIGTPVSIKRAFEYIIIKIVISEIINCIIADKRSHPFVSFSFIPRRK